MSGKKASSQELQSILSQQGTPDKLNTTNSGGTRDEFYIPISTATNGGGIISVSEGELYSELDGKFESFMLVQSSASGEAPYTCIYLSDLDARKLQDAITCYLALAH
jgi:hypothetical protein